jgi:hypothetical protein
MLILSIFMMAFSQAFYVGCEFGTNANPVGEKMFQTPLEAIWFFPIMLMNDVGNAYNYMHTTYYATIVLVSTFGFGSRCEGPRVFRKCEFC